MRADEAPPKLLRVSEVAEQLRVNPQTAYRWIREGTLPAVRVGGTVRVPTRMLVDRLRRGATVNDRLR